MTSSAGSGHSKYLVLRTCGLYEPVADSLRELRFSVLGTDLLAVLFGDESYGGQFGIVFEVHDSDASAVSLLTADLVD